MVEEAPADRSSRPDTLSVLWHVLAAPQTLLVLLGLLVLTLIAACLVPQIPLSARGSPLQWLAAQSNIAGTAWLRSLHLFDLLHSLWIRLLLALLGTVLLIRLVQSTEIALVAWAPRRFGSTRSRLWFLGACEERVSPLPPAEALEESKRQLAGDGYHWLPMTDSLVSTHAASHRRWALWAAPVVYGGFLLALAGTLLLVTWGWKSEQWQPSIGESRAVGADGAKTIRVEGFELQRGNSGRVAATTQVSWHSGERQLGTSFVTGGYPAKQHGLTLRQLGFVPVLSIRGWDENGHPLLLQEDQIRGLPTDAEVVFPDPESHPVLFLEKLNRLLVLGFEAADRSGRPALHLALATSAGGEQVPLGTLYESGSVSFEGSQLQIDIAFRPLLQADRLPGAPLILAGSVLALMAVVLIWVARPRMAWVSAAAEPDGWTRVRVVLAPIRGGCERASAFPVGGERADNSRLAARLPGILHSGIRVVFLGLGMGIAAGAAWAWRTTGSHSGHAVSVGWLLAATLLAAMNLLTWSLDNHGSRWATILAALSAAAVVAGFVA